jgi:hypothetical protein
LIFVNRYLLDEICDTVNGEVSVSYMYHFNVQNMRQTIKLTPLFCNLVPSLLFIRILSIHSFSKFPNIIDSPSERNRFFTLSKESFPEYMSYSTDRKEAFL